ncbi:quinate permease [Kwoniella heveanensis BCC8398]|uniref:Quinate permease n=1 Tax=Kwoniella heveanensis BCC8398 TaxID=1296120 RepID=A0A1B9GKL2_9TREE|nr:quinate permease [Kwoniella heveanensis BCC8398]
MGFKVIEDRPTPPAVYNWRVYIMGCCIAFGALTFGYDAAFIGTTITRPGFTKAFGIDDMTPSEKTSNSANLTSSFTAACFFGAVFAWPMMEAWGRRPALQVSAFIFNVGAIIMTAASTQLSMIYAGRVLTGLGVGIITAVVPSFLAELSPPPIRGVLTGLFEIAYQIGNLVGFWINYGVTHTIDLHAAKSYRIPMAVQLIPGGLFAIGCLFFKESPMLLIKRGRQEEAVRNLEWLRMLPADHHYIQEELAMINNRIEEENRVSGGEGKGVKGYFMGCLREMRVPSIRHRFVLVLGMMFLQNFSGAITINYYSPAIFKAIGLSDTTLWTGIYGLFKAGGSIVFFIFGIDRFGRRVPWMVSATCCGLCLIYLGTYIKVGHPGTATVLSKSTKDGGHAATAIIMLYALFWSFGGNGLPWVVSAEIFPVRLRSLAGAWAGCGQWLSSFAATQAFPKMLQQMDWGVFIFFAGVCAATVLFTFVWIPDTKGVPIQSMDELFGGPSRHSQWRQKKVYPPHGVPPLPLDPHNNGLETPHDHKKEAEDYLEHASV